MRHLLPIAALILAAASLAFVLSHRPAMVPPPPAPVSYANSDANAIRVQIDYGQVVTGGNLKQARPSLIVALVNVSHQRQKVLTHLPLHRAAMDGKAITVFAAFQIMNTGENYIASEAALQPVLLEPGEKTMLQIALPDDYLGADHLKISYEIDQALGTRYDCWSGTVTSVALPLNGPEFVP